MVVSVISRLWRQTELRTRRVVLDQTATEIVDKLNKEINAALADPKIKQRLRDLGEMALPGSPADFGRLVAEETEKWGKVVKFAGIKAE